MYGIRSFGINGFLLAIAIYALFYIVAYLGSLLSKKRIDVLAKYASEHNINYVENPRSLLNCNTKFDINNHNRPHSHGHSYSGLMYGQKDDIEFQITDYSYTVGAGRYSYFHGLTLCLLHKKQVKFPEFHMRKAGFIWNYKKHDAISIRLDDDVFFSDTFVLQGPNKKAIIDFFDSQTRSVFMNYNYLDLQYEAKNNYFLVGVEGQFNCEERMEMLSTSIKIFKKISKEVNNKVNKKK